MENVKLYQSAWSNWFSTEVVRSRGSYFLATMAASLVIGFIAGVGDLVSLTLGTLVSVVGMIPLLIMAGQRFADMGYSRWMSLLTLIPFVNLWPLLARGKGEAESCPTQVKWVKGILIFMGIVFSLIFIAILTGV